MAEAVVFEINVQDAITKLAQLRADTNALKEANKQLAEEVKAGNQEAAKSYEANAIILKNVATEQRNLSKQVEGYADVQKKATDTNNLNNNSIQQNRDLLKQLTAQYINLKNPPKQATEQIKRLSDTLKTQEAAIGDTRRNVGNYAEALGGLANRIPIVGKATDALNRIQSASPVGRLVEIFFALVDALKGNAEVMDTITFLTAAINKGFQLLADKAVSLGKVIVSAFQNPRKILEDIAFVLTNPIEAFKKLSNAALQTGKDLLQAGKDGFDAAKLQDEFTVSIAKTNAAIQENNIQVQALTKSLKDKTKSEKERIVIANQIADLEIKNSELAAKLAQDELDAEELKLKGKKLAAEEEAKIIELTSKVKQAASEQDIAVAQRTTRINILLEKELTNAIKEEKGKQKDLQQQAIENQQKAIEEFTKGVTKELELLDLQQEKRKEFLIQSGLSELEITEKFRQERLDIINKFAQKEAENQINIFDEIIKANLEAAKKQTDIQKKQLQDQQDIQDARLQIAQSFEAGLSSLLSIFGDQAEENAGFQKALALFQIGIDTAVAITSAIRNSQSPTPDNVLSGGLAGVAKAVAITASILSAVAQAKQVLTAAPQPQAPQFAEGGEIAIDGKPHSQGGENVYLGNRLVANVEGGEGLFVMKKNAYQSLSKYSAINEAFGGKSWLKGSSKYLADGGAINTTLPIIESRNRVNSAIEQNRLLAKAIQNIPAPQLSIVELEKKTRTKNKSVRVSEL